MRLWVGALALLILAGAWGALGLFLKQERELALQEASAVTRRLSRTFAEHALRTVKAGDEVALALKAEFQRRGGRIDIPALQRSGIMASKVYSAVSVIGSDGYLAASAIPFKRTYLGDREHVRVHLKEDTAELEIGKPVTGLVSGRQLIPLTRRITAADGSFAGVALVGLAPDYFTGFYESIDIGRDSAIMLAGRDGLVRAVKWESGRAPALGEDVSGDPLFTHLADGSAGNYFDDGKRDGIARVVGFNSVAGYPLVVSVAMSEREALAGLRGRTPSYYLAAAAFTALVLLVSALLIRAISRQSEIGQALSKSEARFRALFENAPVGIVVVSTDAKIIDANSAYLKQFGFGSLEEARGMDAIELYDPSQRGEVEAFHARWRNGDAVEHRWERIRMRRDGTRFHAEVHALPMRLPDGIVGVGFIIDISQSKRMQAELRRANERLELALRGAQLAIVDIDCTTRMAKVHDPCAAMGGGQGEEYAISLQDMERLVHPEDIPRVRRDFIEMLKEDRPPHGADHRICDARDGWRWVSWRATVVERDASGRALRVSGTIGDVSARRRTEEALRQTETMLSLVAANVPGMVFKMTYRAGQFFFYYVSAGSAALLGLAPEALRDNPGLFLQAIREKDRVGLEESLAAATATLETWTWEGRASGPNGELRWIQVRATPTRAFFYGKVFWDGIAMDVTKIKEHEQALQETKRLLRELSAHNEAVREGERGRIARELHDELGQLLTGLKLSLSAMSERDGSPEQAFNKAQNARVMHLVEQAIAVTRNAVMDLRPPALDHGLGAAVAWLADQFARRTGIACSVDLPEQEIELDEARATALFRILQESLTNVAKHAGATSVRIKLVASRDSFRLQVIDDGRGFSEKGAGTPRTFGLLGMRERAGMLGGNIHIASTPGGGTTVHVEITRARKAA